MRTRRVTRLQIVTLAAVAALYCYELRSYDLFLHMHAGRHIFATAGVPRVDSFSALPAARGREWVNHSWLSAVALFLVHEAAGPMGLVLFRMAMMMLTAFALIHACRRGGASEGVCCAAVLLACAAARFAVFTRPMLFTLVLFGVFLWVVRRERMRWRDVALLVALSVLWSNLHAGVIAGLMIVGAHALAQTLLRGPRAGTKLWIALALCAAATLANPFGYKVIAYPLRLAGMSGLMSQVAEWARPSWSWRHWPVAVVAALFVAALAAGRGVWRRPQFVAAVMLAAAFGAVAFRAERNLATFAMFACIVIADGLGAVLAKSPRRRRLGAGAWCGAAVAAMAVLCMNRASLGLGIDASRFPVRGLDVLVKYGLTGGVLSEYRWGGYILWRGGDLDPPMRPTLDGRCEVYREDLFNEVTRVLKLEPGWEQKLRQWDVNVIVFDRAKTGDTIRKTGRWRLIHFDDVCVVWVRKAWPPVEAVGRLDCTPLDPAGISVDIAGSKDVGWIEEGYIRKLAANPRSWFLTQVIAECALRRARASRDAGERRREFARARDLLRSVVQLAPSHAEARYHLAYCFSQLQQWSDALAYYRGAIRLQPQKALYHFGAAQCLLPAGRYDEAEAYFRRAIDLDPAFVPARAQLAELLARQGRVQEAKREIDAVGRIAGAPAARQLAERLSRLAAPRQGGRR